MTLRSVEVRAPRLVAIVPRKILRKWDALAAAQLFEVAPQVADELDAERRRTWFAEDQAEMWERIAEVRDGGDDVGLTMDGSIVAVPRQASAS